MVLEVLAVTALPVVIDSFLAARNARNWFIVYPKNILGF
jgi:hypothetical protein